MTRQNKMTNLQPTEPIPNDVVKAAIKKHIHQLVMSGTLTVNRPGNPHDIERYLQSAEFMRKQQEIRMEVARQMRLPEPAKE